MCGENGQYTLNCGLKLSGEEKEKATWEDNFKIDVT